MNKTVESVINIVKAIYDELLVKKYKDQHFWILSAFIPTFIVARLLVRYDSRIFLQTHGQHVHHFTYGIVLLAISGYLSIVRQGKTPIWLSIMFGIGLALAVDEMGMWLNLTDRYYNETSENALVIATAFLINIVYLKDFWLRLVKDLAGFFKNHS